MKLIKVPAINALGKKGPEKAPNLILNALKEDYKGFSKLELEEIHINNDDVEESEKLIYTNSLDEFGKNDKTIFIGGDHSISFPIVKAFNETFENPFLIVFDAHADTMKPMKEPTHEEWLRAVIEEGFNPKSIILIGVRKIEDVEKEFLDKQGVKYFSEINDVEAIADYVTEKANGRNLYVSIDIDALDPAFAPAVNYPELVGLTSKEFFYILQRVFHVPTLRALDVVEVVPDKDKKYDFRTVKTAAKIIQKFLEINPPKN